MLPSFRPKRLKTTPAHGTFKGNIELKKNSREEYYSLSTAKWQQLYELKHMTELLKGEKTLESSKTLKARVAMLEMKTDNSSYESLVADVAHALVATFKPKVELDSHADRCVVCHNCYYS